MSSSTTTPDAFRVCDTALLTRQIGMRNIMAISGLRVGRRSTGVTLPVACGYRVTVDLAGNDTYTVRRVYVRGRSVWIKGEMTNVYAEDVGEAAYFASCFRDGPCGDNPRRLA